MHLLDEVAEHLLRHVEVGDHTVAEGADGGDVGRGASDHPLRLHPDGEGSPVLGVDRDHGRLVEDDAATAHVYEGVGGAEIDSHVLARKGKKGFSHS